MEHRLYGVSKDIYILKVFISSDVMPPKSRSKSHFQIWPLLARGGPRVATGGYIQTPRVFWDEENGGGVLTSPWES